ncbi:MAG: hypothetical protein GC190_21805 [Alphaproteobacteria bacterium]|nr:hypothetical protein [Alphaproteobacteria bacterium]
MKPRERRVLRFVQSFKETHGNVLPTLSEVAAGVGTRNEEKIRRLVENLTDRGQLAVESVVDEGTGGFVGGTGGGLGGGGNQN